MQPNEATTSMINDAVINDRSSFLIWFCGIFISSSIFDVMNRAELKICSEVRFLSNICVRCVNYTPTCAGALMHSRINAHCCWWNASRSMAGCHFQPHGAVMNAKHRWVLCLCFGVRICGEGRKCGNKRWKAKNRMLSAFCGTKNLNACWWKCIHHVPIIITEILFNYERFYIISTM